ncbi:M16 family metallopeptidase [Neoroseomonas oryzicola]|uniref:Insulinase family protein n=1 Tax=Neoroseomonas oryzicola TaxID=535904 RepID=A0A9X9WFL9_9PROT|nr:pitrilysin family protein [Neoroseomonas oryzicola]MBR0659129.1 insulinase family protein [Neoroseomonas oryzicola]NKE17701.1 insulinase family protein [Neoroseomonas oryzicola]
MTTSFTLPIQVVEAGGFTAWLVEDHSVPVVSLSWSWPGGAARDPAGAEGTAAMAAAMLTEGAGEMRSVAFQDALRDAAIGLSFSAGRDAMEGGFRALTDALPEAVRLARLAMTAPRFDTDAVERVRARAIAGARQSLETPRGQAGRAFWAAAFPNHPAGRPSSGTAESLATVTVDGMRAMLGAQMRRDGVLVAASGAIKPAELAALMQELFAPLPAGAPAAPPALPAFTSFGRQVLPVASPQSQIILGQPGIGAADPDWETAQVVLRVLGGGGFSSRLMEAVRVQRGLTYGIGAGLDSLFGGGIVTCSFATENARVAEAIGVTREVWTDMARSGPTAQELEEAIAFLTGSLPLQFTDSRRIAGTLLAMRRNNRAVDWLDGRNERLRAITQAEATRVAGTLLKPDAIAVTVAGQPTGM